MKTRYSKIEYPSPLLEEYHEVAIEATKQCKLINPSNPLAIARNIEKMVILLNNIQGNNRWAGKNNTLSIAVDELLNDIKKEA